MTVSMRDVAKAAGVSHGTVSHVLNHPQRVSDETRERVLAAIDRLGFVRNESARQLRTGTNRTLALILIDSWTPFFSEVIEGVEEYAYSMGWSVLVANSAADPEREAMILSAFEQRRVAGIMIIPQGEQTIPRLTRMRERGTSCVLVDYDAGDAPLPSVSLDNIAGGNLIGSHLCDLGHRRFMFVGTPKAHVHSRDRLAGLGEALQLGSGNAELSVENVPRLTLRSGRESAQRLMQRPAEHWPDAIFWANDLLAVGALQVFMRRGIQVPKDIAIAGYDDDEIAAVAATPLTTVRQPARQIGYAAAKLTVEDIESGRPAVTERVIFAPELIIRESTTGADPAVVRHARPRARRRTQGEAVDPRSRTGR